jgi:hypothetical protein
MRRDHAEKVFARPEDRCRQDRKDFEEGAEKPAKSAGSSATKERDLSAERKRQAQKITELTKFIKAQGLEPPKKDARSLPAPPLRRGRLPCAGIGC